jgi:hypothetical protein
MWEGLLRGQYWGLAGLSPSRAGVLVRGYSRVALLQGEAHNIIRQSKEDIARVRRIGDEEWKKEAAQTARSSAIEDPAITATAATVDVPHHQRKRDRAASAGDSDNNPLSPTRVANRARRDIPRRNLNMTLLSKRSMNPYAPLESLEPHDNEGSQAGSYNAEADANLSEAAILDSPSPPQNE